VGSEHGVEADHSLPPELQLDNLHPVSLLAAIRYVDPVAILREPLLLYLYFSELAALAVLSSKWLIRSLSVSPVVLRTDFPQMGISPY